MKLKKITFPFYKSDRHHFLTEKWWFRLAIVFYAIVAVVLLGIIWSSFSSANWGWCYDSLSLYVGNNAEFSEHFNQCKEIWEESFALVILATLTSTTVIHYLIQFIFFKIVINFIVLGDNKENQ